MRNVDVVCVGGGLAGASAALRAAELGLRAAVLEQGDDEHYSCNTRISGGTLHVAYLSPYESPEVLAAALADVTFGSVDPALRHMLSERAREAVDWLEACGATLARLDPVAGLLPQIALIPLGATTTSATTGGGSDLLLQAMLARLGELGGELLLGRRVIDLIVEDGRVKGVRAEGPDGVETVHAAGVVLADGGFQGDSALVERYIGAAPGQIVQRSAGTGSGTALRLAQDAGARLVHLDSFYGHLLSRDAIDNDHLWPYPPIDAIAAAGIVVDETGHRFCNEGFGGVHTANQVARRGNRVTLAVCSRELWDSDVAKAPRPPGPNPNIEAHGGTVHYADTIPELAMLAGVDPDNLAATVDAFNAAVAAGTTADLLVPRTDGQASIFSHGRAYGQLTPPFVGIPCLPGITFTMGGPLIDDHACVVGDDGRPIAGLYAAGGSAAGFDGGPDVGYAGGLVRAAVAGRAAAEHLASTLDRRPAGTGRR
ncbi:MAG: FAD-dependent oxidoreductase [Microbacterium sp.]